MIKIELLTAEEVCKKLRLEVRHPGRVLQYYRDIGALRGVKIGRAFRYQLSDVQRFIDKSARLSK